MLNKDFFSLLSHLVLLSIILKWKSCDSCLQFTVTEAACVATEHT